MVWSTLKGIFNHNDLQGFSNVNNEAYESEEAARMHKTTRHYIKWRDIVQDYMATPRKGIRYNIIEPKESTKW